MAGSWDSSLLVTSYLATKGAVCPQPPVMTNSLSGLACSGRQLAIAQFFGQRLRITGIADGHGGDGLPILRDVEDLASFGGVEAGHLMNEQATGVGLEGELRAGAADIVQGAAIGLNRPWAFLSARRTEPARALAFAHPALNSTSVLSILAKFSASSFVATMYAQGCIVGAGRRPACGFEQAAEDFG